MKFNEKLTVLRKERGMNMTEFANLLGTSKQVIARYEKGENTPKITTVAHYAKVLGGWLDSWTVGDIIESVYNKFCK